MVCKKSSNSTVCFYVSMRGTYNEMRQELNEMYSRFLQKRYTLISRYWNVSATVLTTGMYLCCGIVSYGSKLHQSPDTWRLVHEIPSYRSFSTLAFYWFTRCQQISCHTEGGQKLGKKLNLELKSQTPVESDTFEVNNVRG